VAVVLAGIFLLVLVCIRLFRPSWFGIALFASLPLFGFYLDVGVSLEPYKLFAIAFLATLFLTPQRHWRTVLLAKVMMYLAAALILGVLTTTPPFDAFVLSDPGPWRGPGVRWIIASGTLVLTVSLFVVPQVSFSKTTEVRAALAAFVLSTATQAVLGIVQFAWFLLTAVDLFPIQRAGIFGSQEGSAVMVVAGHTVVRACGLAREPKNLAVFLVVALVILLATDGPQERSGPLRYRFVYLTCIAVSMVALLLTFSTTGAFLLPIGFLVVLICRLRVRRPVPRMLWVCLALIGILALVSDSRGESGSILRDAAQTRVVDRVGMLEEYDEVALRYFIENPARALIGTGPGNLPLLAAKITARVAPGYAAVPTWSPKAGALQILANAGVVGLLLIGVLCLSLLRRAWALIRRRPSLAGHIYVPLLVLSYLVIAQSLRDHGPLFWCFLGLLARSLSVGATTRIAGRSSAAADQSKTDPHLVLNQA